MSEPDGAARRERTVTWIDPLPAAEKALRMSGLDYLRALQRGDLPPAPIAVTMGMTMEEVEEARVVFAAEPGEQHYNPIGTVHGGLLATLLDSVMACAV
ncbi:MAG TPA: PaaI family thioesterase, partial [Candidatus Binatia bacterium]|nr:PaaI family thioesterase [Candidatus Binatia bacterium]